MKNSKRRVVKFILVIFIIIFVNVFLYGNDEKMFNGYYIYPTVNTYKGWSDLNTRDKVELCRIPQETLESMSDEQLMQAVLDYPFISEIHMYPTMEYGVEVFESICDAYAELIERECGLETMIEVVNQRVAKGVDNITAEEEIQNDQLATMIFYQMKFQDELTDDEKEIVKSISRLVQNYEIDKEEGIL